MNDGVVIIDIEEEEQEEEQGGQESRSEIQRRQQQRQRRKHQQQLFLVPVLVIVVPTVLVCLMFVGTFVGTLIGQKRTSISTTRTAIATASKSSLLLSSSSSRTSSTISSSSSSTIRQRSLLFENKPSSRPTATLTSASASTPTIRQVPFVTTTSMSSSMDATAATTTTTMAGRQHGTATTGVGSTKEDKPSSSSSSPPSSSSSSEDLVPRYTGPKLEDMTPDQKDIRDYILESRPRTGLSGPFGPWMAVPEIARPASQLGKACRYDTSLQFKESELVILLTGAYNESPTEFDIHVGEAIKAGWTMDVIQTIPRSTNDFTIDHLQSNLLPLLQTDRERALTTFVAELLVTKTVSDQTYGQTKAAFDNQDSVLVEITSIVGYYTYVAMTLNVFQIPSK